MATAKVMCIKKGVKIMTGKESLEKYNCTVPCRKCEYDDKKRNEMPCLMCVIRPPFSKDIMKNKYIKFTERSL